MRSCTSRGFTLFELMLALGLSVVLLAAITSALQLYWSYSTAGRARMEQSQLSRAIIEKIQLDVRSVVFRQPNPMDLQIDNSQAANAGITRRVEIVRDKSKYLVENVGIVGDGQRLLLHINRASRISHGERAERGGVQFVIWYVAERGPAGLARQSADGTAINPANSQSFLTDSTSVRDDENVVAEEVSSIGFRYWDGKAWLESWDSVEAKELPRAVEVAIGFGPGNRESRDNGLHRTVIPIAISEPQPPSVPGSQLQ